MKHNFEIIEKSKVYVVGGNKYQELAISTVDGVDGYVVMVNGEVDWNTFVPIN